MRGLSHVIASLPSGVRQDLGMVGSAIGRARKARGLSQEKMAARMLVSRTTLHRLESGDPAVGLAVLASALFVLGQARRLRLLADPDDRLERPSRRGIARSPVASDDLDF